MFRLGERVWSGLGLWTMVSGRLRLGLNRRSFDHRTLFGRFLDALLTVNKRPKSVEKAKASSVPVDLRERFFDAVLSTLLVTMAIERRFCLCSFFCRLVSDLVTVKKHVQNRNTRPSLETTWTNRRELNVRPKSVCRSNLRLLRPSLRLSLRSVLIATLESVRSTCIELQA